jgi:RNA polymerase sigma-70 factor, ECF subfamily
MLLQICADMRVDLDFESLVEQFYAPLYRFALSLTHDQSDACDLTQQTFFIWATKGQQLKDSSKVKSWLFTTMHRQFLQLHRRQERFRECELSEVESELPQLDPVMMTFVDGQAVVSALSDVDAVYRSAVSLFYLEDFSYNEIGELLDIPLGTVKSRIARGIAQLQAALALQLDERRPPKNIHS